MAFKWTWPSFSPDFLASAQSQVTQALNRGDKPPNIVGDISVTKLCLGTRAPELEILGIDELLVGLGRSRSIYRLVYNGDAHLVLSTHVQANPLKVSTEEISLRTVPSVLAANKPLVVPMQISIAQIRLRGVMSLVIDQDEGVTIKFKSDPLESVQVSSSFDNVDHIKKFLQAQIEGQLRALFSNELPQIIHQLSLEFLQRKTTTVGTSSGGQANNMQYAPSIARTASGGTTTTSSQDEYYNPFLSPRSIDLEVGSPLYSPLEYPPSGYTSDYKPSFHARNPSDGTLSRSHSQKWMGNDPVPGIYGPSGTTNPNMTSSSTFYDSDNPRLLTRRLAASHDEMDGLGRLTDPPPLSPYGSQVLSRESLYQLTSSAPDLSRTVHSSSSSSRNTSGPKPRRSQMGSGFRRLRIAGDAPAPGSRTVSVTGSTYSAPNLDGQSYYHQYTNSTGQTSSSTPIYHHHHHRHLDDTEDWIIPQSPAVSSPPVDVHPTDSRVSAHLINLMTSSNRSISNLAGQGEGGRRHMVVRADPTARSGGGPVTSPTKALSASGEFASSSPVLYHSSSSSSTRHGHHRRRPKDRSPLHSTVSTAGNLTCGAVRESTLTKASSLGTTDRM